MKRAPAPNIGRFDEQLDAREVENIARSVGKYATGFALTDLGNAQRLVTAHGRDLRYVPEFKKWLTWDSTRWVFDEDGAVMRRAKATAIAILAEAAGERDDSRRAALARWASLSQSESRLRSMVALAQSEPGMFVHAGGLDSDPMLMGLENATLDLRTGMQRAPRHEDYITKRAAVEFKPTATCPTWMRFLDRIFAGDAALIAFMQRAVGYCLTGNTSEQCLFLLYGSGRNGKTSFLATIGALLGDYATSAPAETFMVRRREGANNDIARLRGARLVSAIETEDGQRLAESLVKQLTGQDTVSARFLYGEFFQFVPAFKLFLAANHKPVVRGDDHAIWRRIRFVPCVVQIPEAEQDRGLVDRLRDELPGILNWAIAGCLEWQRTGLRPPQPVLEATSEYRAEMDVMGDFIEAACLVGEEFKAPAGRLYAEYRRWAEENGRQPMTQQALGRKLSERGFAALKESGGLRVWNGIGVGF